MLFKVFKTSKPQWVEAAPWKMTGPNGRLIAATTYVEEGKKRILEIVFIEARYDFVDMIRLSEADVPILGGGKSDMPFSSKKIYVVCKKNGSIFDIEDLPWKPTAIETAFLIGAVCSAFDLHPYHQGIVV